VKDSPQQIGFVFGAMLGFAWLVYENARTTRNGGTANWIFIMICGGIGWLIGSLFSFFIK
jgi:hypothetical protein